MRQVAARDPGTYGHATSLDEDVVTSVGKLAELGDGVVDPAAVEREPRGVAGDPVT